MEKNSLSVFKSEMKLRTKTFAHDCVKLALELPNDILGIHIRKQLVRCSTSVAANYRASCIAQSVPSVIAKMSIAIEEADESEFWIEFAIDEQIISTEKSGILKKEANELASILIKSRKTLQGK